MLTRREILARTGLGFGALSLNRLLAASPAAKDGMLAPKPTHFPAKAKHVIFLFLNGGPSQVDTFDPKPLLTRHHGTPAPGGNLKTERKTGNLMKSPFDFRRCGKSGIEVTPDLLHERPESKVLVLSMEDDHATCARPSRRALPATSSRRPPIPSSSLPSGK